jgi:hypothetical protein
MVDIKIGHNESESVAIIKNMIDSETSRCENFARGNPKTMLPMNLDVVESNKTDNDVVQELKPDFGEENVGCVPELPIDGDEKGNMVLPQGSLKDPASSELWTEVVKWGRPRGKARSKNMKRGAF